MDFNAYLEKFKTALIDYGPDLIAALAIVVLGWFAAKIVTGIFKRGLGRANVEPTLTAFLANIVYMLLLALVIIAALGKLGVNTTSFAAVIAAAGLAIGLALQGSLGNFASGVMLILFRPFKAGDYVEAGGVSGVVEEVSVFATKLRTPDNKAVIVGNGQIWDGAITNYSAKDTRRVDMTFGIGYDDDIRKAKEILERLIAADERCLKDPAPTVAVGGLGDSSVDLLCRPWVNTADYWAVFWDFQERVKLEYDAAGISIPFPQRDVHLYKTGAAEAV